MTVLRHRQRILVVGCGGAGKSTFARALGAVTGLPVIHLDSHFWKPNGQPTPSDEWNALVAELASRDAWIMDGNYGGSLAVRLRRADAIVFFDFDRLTCLCGVIKRRWSMGNGTRPDMAPDCAERLSLRFLRWIWRYPADSRPRIVNAIATGGGHVEAVTVATRTDVENLLRACTRGGD
jgi:adenylate kinase family enzyme